MALIFTGRALAERKPGLVGRWLWVEAFVLLAMTAFSIRPGDSLLGLFNYVPFFLFFGLTVQLIDSERRRAQLLQVALWSGFVTGLAGTVEWLSGRNWQWEPVSGVILLMIGSQQEAGILDRVTSFFAWPTSAAAYFLLILPVAMAMAMARLKPWLSWSVLLTITPALLGTASRNAWASMLVVSGALLLFARRFWLMAALGSAAVLVLFAGLGPADSWPVATLRFLIPAALWQKVAESAQSGTASFESLTNRFEAWQIAFEMTLARPLTGWGLQTFPFVEQEVFGRSAENLLHAHNLYLTYTAETGIPAALGLIGFYFWTLIAGVRTALKLQGPARVQLIGLLAALAAYLLFGLSDVPFYESRINALFWAWLGLIWSYSTFLPTKATIE